MIVVVYIPRGTVHRNQNLSGQPVRTVELMIVDKTNHTLNPSTERRRSQPLVRGA